MTVTDVQLWQAWCAAADLDPDQADAAAAAAFVEATSRSRTVRYRRAASVRAHLGQPSVRTFHVETFDPGDALAGLPRTGWPAGLNRCRDAFIVVASSVGLTRQQIRHLGVDDVDADSVRPMVANRPAPIDPAPARCGACAVIDWLEIVAATVGGGRGEAQRLLTAPSQARHRHQLSDIRWQSSHQLLPAIDVHGWPDHSRPISLRTITAALNRAPVVVLPPAAPAPLRHTDADIDQLLDQLDEEADTSYAKVAEVMRALGLEPDRPTI